MKKGHSKNRHHSKGICSLKQRKARRSDTEKYGTSKKVEQYHIKKKLYWKHFIEAIQLADFLIDKVPLLIKWMVNLLGMG